jgi:hypothetical protein
LFIDETRGSAIAGSTLKAGNIIYSEPPSTDPTLQWQWYMSDSIHGTYSPIAGATTAELATNSTLTGRFVNVSVTATGSATGTAISDPVQITALVFKPLRPIAGFYPVVPGGSTSQHPFSGGTGTATDPFIITTPDQFMLLQSNTTDTWFKLGNDLDLSGKGSITEPFYGHLDGAGHVVGFRSTSGNGLFGDITAGASVRNLRIMGRNRHYESAKLVSCSVGNLANRNYGTISGCSVEDFTTGIYNAVNVRSGGLVGRNLGLIEKSFTSGNFLLHIERRDAINGHYPSLADDLLSDYNRGWVGGLVGVNMEGGVIRDCYSLTNITLEAPGELSYGFNGGLAGTNLGRISNSFAAGKTTETKYRGGLVGYQRQPGFTEYSFYDKQVAGRSDNDGRGMPKTTVDMKKQATFVGWDFTAVWTMPANGTAYPALR